MGTTRQANVDGQEFATLSRDAITLAATTTCGIATAQRPFRVDAIELISDATIAQDPANFYSFALQVGGRTVGTWSCQTGQQGTITAAVPAAVPLAAESGQNRVAAKGDVIQLVCTKAGTAAAITNLRAVAHGRYVG